MQRVDEAQLCDVLLESHLDAAMGKGIDLGIDAAPVHVTGHEWLLRELMGNLVDNAIKYTPAGGRVTLRCGLEQIAAQEPGRAFVEVEDDGPGVPVLERERIVERFYRVKGTQGDGNGLGLAIADEIARVHQSQLRFATGAGGRGLRVSMWFAH
jgi:two-component system, OmpR family, sensor histidine kinase TctE